MSDDTPEREELARRVAELTETVESLEQELERPRRRRRRLGPPSIEDLRRFTADVAIPGLIVLLETNVRVLKLLRRILEIEEDRQRASDSAEALAEQATAAGSTALSRLEEALVEVQSALEDEPADSEATELLDDARELREDIQSQLGENGADAEGDDRPTVDVEAELQSIKDQMDDDEDDED